MATKLLTGRELNRALLARQLLLERSDNTKTPHSMCTFLVDSAVTGTWRHEGGRVVPAPFETLAPAVAAEVEAEAARLTEFHA